MQHTHLQRIQLFLYTFVQLTWGCLQTLLGAVFYIRHLRAEHSYYQGAIVTHWDKPYGMGTGLFIFICDHQHVDISPAMQAWLLRHEYGHTLQSILLGPFFLLIIGLPSLLWAGLPFFARYRKKHHLSYYSLYCEKWANRLGGNLS